MNWISIDDRLPQFQEEVLVSFVGKGDPDVVVAYRYRGCGHWSWWAQHKDFDFDDDDQVTHWMPLPPPATSS